MTQLTVKERVLSLSSVSSGSTCFLCSLPLPLFPWWGATIPPANTPILATVLPKRLSAIPERFKLWIKFCHNVWEKSYPCTRDLTTCDLRTAGQTIENQIGVNNYCCMERVEHWILRIWQFRPSKYRNGKYHIWIRTIVFSLSKGQHETLPADVPSVGARESSVLSSGGGLAKSAVSLTLSTFPSPCALWSASVPPTAKAESEVEIVPLLVKISGSEDRRPLLFLAFDASPCPAAWRAGVTCKDNFLCLISARETGSESVLFLLILCSLSLRRMKRGSDLWLICCFRETPCVSWENPTPAPARLVSFAEACFETLRLTVTWSLSEILTRKKNNNPELNHHEPHRKRRYLEGTRNP